MASKIDTSKIVLEHNNSLLLNEKHSFTKSFIEDKDDLITSTFKSYDKIECFLKDEYENSFNIVNNLLGLPYMEIYHKLLAKKIYNSFYQDLFRRACIYEIYSSEKCKYIFNIYKKLNCNMIYFYNDQSGSIGRAFKNCDYFKKDDTNIPPYKIFDKSPELVKYTYYDKVQKMNISAKIKEEDQNKKILLVITYSNLEMLDSIKRFR